LSGAPLERSLSKPLKSPEQLGLMLWNALRAEKPAGYRNCVIEVVRAKAGAAEWEAGLVMDNGTVSSDLARVFARAKSRLQDQYGWLDD
jgi:hypothetical protein